MSISASASERDIPPSFYNRSTYETESRFMSYYHQIAAIREFMPHNLLEVGIGSGFVARHLSETGIIVVTADINEQLGPDVVASIMDLPFADVSFDIVAAFEVLEHLPLDKAPLIMAELRRITRNAVIISVPNCTPAYPLQVSLPVIGRRRWIIERHVRAGMWEPDYHHWEIGHAGVSPRTLIDIVEESGFVVQSTYRIFERPYCHMFILTKRCR